MKVQGTPPKILHVIESFGAGSANAMRSYVRAMPSARHFLLRGTRPGEFSDDETLEGFDAVFMLPRSPRLALRQIRQLLRDLEPSIVHAHSSVAGALVRSTVMSSHARPIIYTPHCFSFERRDLSALMRGTLFAAEWLLSLNTSIIAACSPEEMRLARLLPSRRPPVLLPNVASVPEIVQFERQCPARGTLRITGMGRLSAQKDPVFFAQVVKELRRKGVAVEAVWIGGGDYGADELSRADVRVTGWVGSSRVAEELVATNVYVHTALWEGFPLAILDAVALGLPVVARDMAALRGAPRRFLCEDVEKMTAALIELRDSSIEEHCREVWRDYVRFNTVERQAEVLSALYGVTVAS